MPKAQKALALALAGVTYFLAFSNSSNSANSRAKSSTAEPERPGAEAGPREVEEGGAEDREDGLRIAIGAEGW